MNDFYKKSYIQCQKNFIYGKEDCTGNNFRRWCADTNTIKTEKQKNGKFKSKRKNLLVKEFCINYVITVLIKKGTENVVFLYNDFTTE